MHTKEKYEYMQEKGIFLAKIEELEKINAELLEVCKEAQKPLKEIKGLANSWAEVRIKTSLIVLQQAINKMEGK